MNMRKKSADGSSLVYSTEYGRICQKCDRPAPQCACGHKAELSSLPAQTKLIPSGCKKAPAKDDGIVRISRETKGRKGSGVTLISGLPLVESELIALARQFERGGTEELENPYIFNAPDVAKAGGLGALKILGEPHEIINEAKRRLFAA